MVFISFVLSIPTSRTSTGDRVEPFFPTREKGWPLALKKSQQGISPFRQSGFVQSTFLSFPAIGVHPVSRGKERTGASIGVLKSKAIGAATFSTEARHPFTPSEGNAAFDEGKEAIAGKQYRGTERWCQKASQPRIGKLWKGEERCRPTSAWSS
jgi:hypothetical protein